MRSALGRAASLVDASDGTRRQNPANLTCASSAAIDTADAACSEAGHRILLPHRQEGYQDIECWGVRDEEDRGVLLELFKTHKDLGDSYR